MRKIVAGLFISIDGVIDNPGNWQMPYFSDAMGEAIGAQIGSTDTMLLGRKTWDEFAGFWPTADAADPMTAAMNDTPKYVVSRSLTDVSAWQNSTVLSGDLVKEVSALKERDGRNIGITGSGQLVRTLLAEGLLDELTLHVHPIVLGAGVKLFPPAESGQVPLRLTDSKTFDKGVVSVTYVPA